MVKATTTNHEQTNMDGNSKWHHTTFPLILCYRQTDLLLTNQTKRGHTKVL